MTPPAQPQPWIRPLPERLINKIAAGEVVERPASVVKELTENSLDAGADRIEIAIEKSGTRLIRIIDNGCGIPEEQIEVAFSRHATSKISEFKDLDRITSYGFRGEALPSIASVSRVRMVSRSQSAETGTEVIYEAGVLQSKRPISAPEGTTIEVENIFFNTPARRKFLKAESTEARHISRAATAMAIGKFHIGFSYNLNGRQVFALPPGLGLGERVAGLLSPGKDFIRVAGKIGPLEVEGYVGPPDLAQSNRYSQYIFINGRYIQSPVLAHAFASGFGEMLPRGNFPIGALLLSVDPTEIDVNVHPAKTEVRLSREREIHDALHRLIKESLRQEGVMPDLRIPGRPLASGPSNMTMPPPQSNQNVIPGITGRSYGGERIVDEMMQRTPPIPYDSEGTVSVDTRTGEIIEPSGQAVPQGTGSAQLDPEQLRLIGCFDSLYLLFQNGSELLVIDQHTAHERVLYEKMLRKMDNEGGTAQQLLLPVQVELGPEQVDLFEESRPVLNHAGFGAEPFGGNTVRIEAVPAILSRKSPEKAFRAVLDDIASLKKVGYDLKKAVAQSVACRSAVMSGDRLSEKEAVGLVTQLLQCENRYSCPHGRPTFVKMTREQLDRQFGRA